MLSSKSFDHPPRKATPGPAGLRPSHLFTPRLRIFTERMGIIEEGRRSGYREQSVPCLSLVFDYGGHEVRASDGVEDAKHRSTGAALVRNLSAEREAQRMLEVYGVLEVDCLDDIFPLQGSRADYVITGGNLHALCAFTAYASELKQKGWHVEIESEYPYQVVARDAPWYAKANPRPLEPDWFDFELGVEVDGHRINLLPALLEMLDALSKGSDLGSLLDVSARGRALPIGDHRHVMIPRQRLERILLVLIELHRGGRSISKLRCPSDSAGALARLEAAFSSDSLSLEWEDPQNLKQRGELFLEAPRPVERPVSLRADLRPYQQQGVAWLQHLRRLGLGGVLADDMGLGKTLQTITSLLLEKESHRATQPSLIVAPTSLLQNWLTELQRFAPALKARIWHGHSRHKNEHLMLRSHVIVTTYSVLVRDLERFKNLEFHYLILDEAQAIKNHRSQAAKALCQLKAQHRLCLTGTPVENNLGELHSLFQFLMPNLLGSAEAFRKRFADPIEKEQDEVSLDVLRQTVGPFILRRMKEDVLSELPSKTEMVRPIELSAEQRDLYESLRVAVHGQVRRAIRERGVTGSRVTILDGLMKLRQVCCDPRLVTVPGAQRGMASAKCDFFFELLSTELRRGRKILVFSQFAQMLGLLGAGLQKQGTPFTVLTGATRDRHQAVREFQEGKADVFLISLKAGGTGLNLTRADTVIHYDPWWNAAAQSQATCRAYRLGQKNPVFVHNLIVAGSVEERMLHLQGKKSYLAETLLSRNPESEAGLSASDVEDLFAPLSCP